MNTQDFTLTLTVDETPEVAFKAINNVRAWWGEGIEGGSERLGDEFIYCHKDLHYSKQKLIEVISGEKVVWLVTGSRLNFTEAKSEWTGSKIIFEIFKKESKTHIRFTHLGLVPGWQCFQACSGGWRHYLVNSLFHLIANGKGQPDPKENHLKSESELVTD